VTVYWLPEAIIDRQEIFDYVSTRNPASAIGLDNRFEKAAKDLEFFPDMGAPGLMRYSGALSPRELSARL
jgi:toxin ParE1/3/4